MPNRLASFEEKHGGKEGLEKYIEQRALTMEELRESAKKRVYVNEYLRIHGITEPEIPEDRIRQMYEGNPESYLPRRVRPGQPYLGGSRSECDA